MKNWRTTILGLIILFATYYQQIGGKLPESGKEWGSFAVGFVVFIGLSLSRDPEWLKRLVGPAQAAILCLLLTGCVGGPMGFTGMNPEQIAAFAKVKDAGVSCARGVYAGAVVTFVSVSSDKGVPAGVTVDSECKVTFATESVKPSASTP